MQPHPTLGDHINSPIPTPRRLHRHLRVGPGRGHLGSQVRRRVVDPRPRHPLTRLVQHHNHRPLSVQDNPYVRSHQSLLAQRFDSAPRVFTRGPNQSQGARTPNQLHMASLRPCGQTAVIDYYAPEFGTNRSALRRPLRARTPGKVGAKSLTAVGKSPPRLWGQGPLAPGERQHPARRPSWSSLDETIQVDRTPSNTPPRRRFLRRLGIGTAIVRRPGRVGRVRRERRSDDVRPTARAGTTHPRRHRPRSRRTRRRSGRHARRRNADHRPGFEPAPRTRDDIVRDLVARGVVPAATLDDGTQITGPGFEPAPRTRDDIVRDLVARGVVPAATLDDGTQITSPALDTVIARRRRP